MIRVRIVPYDPSWPAAFEAHRLRLADALGEEALSIEHIGSTAVPGCDAKPIIDIIIGRAPGSSFAAWRDRLAPLGLTHARQDSTSQGEGQWFFRDPPRTVHVHVYDQASEAQRRHLRFRDALGRDPELRQAYLALKRRLAAQEWPDRQAYVDAKTEFVQRVEQSAAH